jgi:excisionase family DNA binding protein
MTDDNKPAFRPPSAYVHGLNGPVVILPARVCAWLEYHAALNKLRIERRGIDPEVDQALVAVRVAAVAWRTSATGRTTAPEPEVPEEWVSTAQAAEHLGITDRAVRLAIKEGRLTATQVDGNHRISSEALAHFIAARNAA